MANYVNQGGVSISISPPSSSTLTIPGPWAQISGDEAEREVQKARPGVGEAEVLLSSRLVHGDLTVQKMFNADTDVAFIKALNAGQDFAGSSIVVKYCDADGNVIAGAQVSHNNCVVKSFSAPEGDANSTDQAMLSVTWSRGGAS